MQIRKLMSGVFISLFSSQALCSPPQLKDNASIPKVIAAMTLQEKAAFVTGTGMNNATNVPGAAGSTLAIPRLGIPQVVFSDGPVGVRLGAGPTGGKKRYATSFPVSVAMAATWDPALIKQVGSAIGQEARHYGIDLLLGPAINIQRSPLDGRNFEFFSEDPVVSGHIAASYINGLQEQGVGAVLKHFVANNQETRRLTINEIISQRALNEIYFPAFKYAIEHSHPWVVMSAYPTINGIPAAMNSMLLKDTLRKAWGFNGLVMSDWYGVADPVHSLIAGNDLNMPGGPSNKDTPFIKRNGTPQDVILAGLKNREISEDQIDENIRNILGLVLKTQAFRKTDTKPLLGGTAHANLSREVAADAMVLLKNQENTLPIHAPLHIAAFGSGIDQFYLSGGGSAEVNIDPALAVTLPKGLQNAGFSLDQQLKKKTVEITDRLKTILKAAQQDDIALISVDRTSSEGADRYTMEIKPEELALIHAVADAFHRQNKKLIVLLNVGSPIDIAPWEKYADAILLTWLPGQQGGNAVADILSGKVNPSGRLPETFPQSRRDAPDYGNFPGDNKNVIYGEGIYVGYRWYDTRNITPEYPFGYGLSYSKINYDNISPASIAFNLDKDKSVSVQVGLTNTSSMAAKEVAQLYIQENASRLDRPFQELKAFQKVSLNAGEHKVITFQVSKEDLSFYDSSKQSWVVEPGKFTLRIGSSSRDIRIQIPLMANSATPAFTLNTPWIEVQTYEKAASIVARLIGEDEVNSWIKGNPSLGDKLEESLKKKSEFSHDPVRRAQTEQQVLKEINAL
jgi:beta-glucosidase